MKDSLGEANASNEKNIVNYGTLKQLEHTLMFEKNISESKKNLLNSIANEIFNAMKDKRCKTTSETLYKIFCVVDKETKLSYTDNDHIKCTIISLYVTSILDWEFVTYNSPSFKGWYYIDRAEKERLSNGRDAYRIYIAAEPGTMYSKCMNSFTFMSSLLKGEQRNKKCKHYEYYR